MDQVPDESPRPGFRSLVGSLVMDHGCNGGHPPEIFSLGFTLAGKFGIAVNATANP